MKEKNKRTKDRIFTIFLFLGLSFTAFSQTGPKVVATGPAANALDVDNTATIGLTFSEAMDAATLNAANIKISGNCGPPLGFPAPGVTGATAVLDPDRDFFPGEVITATLTVGAASSTGNPLANPFTYRFTAGVDPDSPGEFPNGQNIISVLADDAGSVAAADLDGDGDLDVLSASDGSGAHIAWYENNGSGNFGGQRIIATEADGATSVTTGDLDGDGDLDVLLASAYGINIAWYENDGSGNFGGRQVITTAAYRAGSVATADLDGDGDLDVLSASLSDDRIAWYGNDGNGNFGSQRTITTAAIGATDVTVADLDGDGDLDVLSASIGGTHIAWYGNDGSGNFSGQRAISGAAFAAYSVTTADLDGDGDLDVLSASDGGGAHIAWYGNDGSGNFGGQRIISEVVVGARSVTTADLDGDGDLDVLLASFWDDRVAWYENKGSGNFGALRTITTAADGAIDVATGDLDGDGDLDVLSASSRDGRIAWYENAMPLAANCTAPFTLQLDAGGTAGIAVADIDNGSTGATGMDIDITDLDCSDLGTNTVTLTVTNSSGDMDSCATTVIVEDIAPPMAIARDITVGLDENGQATIEAGDIDNGSTDNCGIAELSLDTAIFDCPELGDTNVELTVTDVSGNSHSATATVTFTAPDSDSDGVADVCGLEASIVPGQGVSPNGDGIHDTWTIGNIADHPEAVVKVFDRNGREVFGTDGYRNDWGGTEGTGSSLLPVGSYYYVVHLQRPIARNITGWLYLNY